MLPLAVCSMETMSYGGKDPTSYLYLVPIGVGSPLQKFTVLVDTGSQYLWLPSAECPDEACQRHREYHSEQSNTSRSSETTEGGMVSFETGQLVGFPVQDVVCIAGICLRLKFMSATEESKRPFLSAPFDGILGLGPSSVPPMGSMASTVSQELQEQCGLSLFVLRLTAKTDCLPGHGGEVAFARSSLVLQKRYGTATWAPMPREVPDNTYWLVRLLSVRVGQQELLKQPQEGHAKPKPTVAAVDSGSTYMLMPQDVLERLLGMLKLGDCTNTGSLPYIVFRLQGVGSTVFRLVLGPDDYVVQNGQKCDVAFSYVMATLSGQELWVLGRPLLSRYISVYDRAQNRVGFILPDSPPRTTRVQATTKTAASGGIGLVRERRLKLHVASKRFAVV